MSVLEMIGWALAICAWAGNATGRLPLPQFAGLFAAASGAWCLDAIRSGDTVWALIQGVITAVFLRAWWNGGGGNGPRRRLRALARRFRPVRRTAPSQAARTAHSPTDRAAGA